MGAGERRVSNGRWVREISLVELGGGGFLRA